MRVVLILAALLLWRAGGLAHATWSDRQDARDEASAQASRGVDLTIDQSFVDSVYARTVDEGFRRALERAARDVRNAGYGACGCGSRVGPDGRLGGPV